MDLNKPMPYNLDAERGVLGIILKNCKAIGEVIGILKPTDFYFERHRIIYSCMVNLFSRDINIDSIMLAEELNKQEKLQEVGGVSYIAELIASTSIADSIKNYAETVKEKSHKRALIITAQNMISEAYKDGSEIKAIISNAEDNIYKISENKENKTVPISESVEKAITNIQQIYANGGGLIGVSSGLSIIDKLLNGLQKGDFIILAARPSMGKTAFALNVCTNVAKNSKAAFFSLEMSEEQVTQRILSSFTTIELSKLRAGKLNDNEWSKLAQNSSLLATRNLIIDDTAETTVNEIKAKCRNLKIKHGLDVVVIDYLQLIESYDNKSFSREQEISKISRSLKKMAKELDITVIALSQLSRAPEQRPDHRPILSDLRESGSIEQDADVVMFLYRDEYYNAESEEKNIAECIVAKNRNGQIGIVKLAWLGKIQRFANLDTVH